MDRMSLISCTCLRGVKGREGRVSVRGGGERGKDASACERKEWRGDVGAWGIMKKEDGAGDVVVRA